MQNHSSILALDVGAARIGVARANRLVRLASPLMTLSHTPAILDDIVRLVREEDAGALVLGLPRGLQGQHTDQTRTVEAFAETLRSVVGVPLYFQDEALTSRKAEEELRARGKAFEKGDIDALAATYILEDFLQDHPEVATSDVVRGAV